MCVLEGGPSEALCLAPDGPFQNGLIVITQDRKGDSSPLGSGR